MLRFSGAGVSDVGRVRPHNEDSGFVAPYVAVVADGVGVRPRARWPRPRRRTSWRPRRWRASVRRWTSCSSTRWPPPGRACATASRDDPTRLGMATTLTAVATHGDRVLLAHAGDSRAYLLRRSADGPELRQVSRDHTYVQAMLDEHRLTPERARHHPWRNVVLRSLDSSPTAEHTDVDLVDLHARPGDRLLLCSDGLTDLVDDERIASVLGLHEPLAAAAVLTQSALSAGGRDNITCVVLDVVDGPVVVGDGTLLGALRDSANIVDPAAVRLT